MSDDEKPSIVERLKSRLRFSLAVYAAAAVGISLVLLAALAWLLYSLDPSRIAWGDYMTIDRAVGLLALWVMACFTTYFTVRIWMSDLPVGNTRIREGWNAGITMLSKHSATLSQRPCFLVLGCMTRHQQDSWVGAEGYSTSSDDAGLTPAIDWHLSDDRILIFCRDVGVYGGLLRDADSVGRVPAAPAASIEQSDADQSDETAKPVVDSEAPASDLAESTQEQEADHETSEGETDNLVIAPTSSSPTALTTAPVATDTAVKPASTAVTDAMRSLDRVNQLVHDVQQVTAIVPREVVPEIESLSSVETSACQESLSELCTRLRAARFPHSGINGTLVIVDSSSLEHEESARKIGRAVGSDLEQIRSELGVWSPVTMMVSETDYQRDCAELFRRLRIVDKEDSSALGQTFDSEQIPTVESMNALADDAIHQIESRIHRLFRSPRATTQPHNHRLVRMLIRCRRWRSALRSLLVESCTPCGASETDTTPIVSGLFVGSPDPSPITQTFTQAVFDRMVSQQNHLAWTAQQQQRTSRHRRLLKTLTAVTAILTLAMLLQLTWVLFS